MFNERLFRAKVVYNGYTLSEVAKKIDINESTLHRKLKDGGTFTRSEISKLIDALNLTSDELTEIFFAENL